VAGDVGAVQAPLPGKDLGVVAGGVDAGLEPAVELVLESLTGELLHEDRGDAESDAGAEPALEE
jgi:hypothetical protein